MNLEYFIAKRLIKTKGYKSSVSSPIIKIAIAAISIGIVMMLLSIATGQGLQKKIREKIAVYNGHIIISPFDENESQINTTPIEADSSFYNYFKSIDGISHYQAVATKAGIIRTEKGFEGILLKGVNKDYDWSLLSEYLIEGTTPNTANELNNQVILSEYLANRLQLKVGDKFNTFFVKKTGNQIPNLRVFELVGIYNSGFEEFDKNLVLGDLRHVQRINKWKENEVGNIEVFLNNFDQIEGKGLELYEALPPELNATTIVTKYNSIFELLQLFDFNILVIIVIMILVATINMVVALLVLILERTQMIGILKSFGASNWNIRKIFLYNASYLIGKGLLIGNGIGLGLLFIQHQWGIIKLEPKDYYVNQAQVYIEWWQVILLNSCTLLICLLVLLVPSYIISKIAPSKAIRFS
ncbi:MAG: ABC transporter permease [Flavobacteriales bacterium]|nr:ABC transporter permease [Flavobacteriales bacterium]